MVIFGSKPVYPCGHITDEIGLLKEKWVLVLVGNFVGEEAGIGMVST